MSNTGKGFPATRHSLLEVVRTGPQESRERAMEALLGIYWRPTYKYLRVKLDLSREDAEDLTQSFFAHALGKQLVEEYDPSKARFRTFLRLLVDRFASNQRRSERRIKRGGDTRIQSLDFEAAENEIALVASSPPDPDEYFRREWARALFESAVAELRSQYESHGKLAQFSLFERYDLDASETQPSYRDLAEQVGLSMTQVTNGLAAARRDFRRIVLDRLRQVSGSDEEFRAEARDLLGVDPV